MFATPHWSSLWLMRPDAEALKRARERVTPHLHETPVLTSRSVDAALRPLSAILKGMVCLRMVSR